MFKLDYGHEEVKLQFSRYPRLFNILSREYSWVTKWFTSAKTVYIVTDVLKVSGMTVAVSGDDDRVTFQNLNSHFPVGFAYNKFRLGIDGCVCEAVGTCKCCQSVLNYLPTSQMDSGIRMEAKWRVLTDQLTPYLNILPALDD